MASKQDPATDPPSSVHPPADPSMSADAMKLIIQMQQQQLAMQEQMAQMMTQIIPKNAMQQPNDQESPSRRYKPARPLITSDCTDNKWIIFADAWRRYKVMARLTDPDDIRNELRSACDPSVNEMLYNFVGPDILNTATEDELLSHIKSVAVKSVHREVYRQQFSSMRQGENESITRYISRLKSQAMLCDFVRKCDCPNHDCRTSFSEDMVMSQIITGLFNPTHQSKVLSDMARITTLQALTERLLTLESTSQATIHFRPEAGLTTTGTTAPIRSDYQRTKIKSIKQGQSSTPTQDIKKPISDKCRGCGRNRHTTGRGQCPAQGQRCNACGKMNHFATVCMSSKTNAISEEESLEDVSFLSSVTNGPSL